MIRRRTITLKLTRRPDGWWVKSIGNKLHYFGVKGSTEAQARAELIEFLRLRESGQQPPTFIKLVDLADHYGTDCVAKVQRGDMQVRTWTHYEKAIRKIIADLGGDIVVSSIPPAEWDRIAAKWRKDQSANRSNNDIQAVRTMFRWAHLNGFIDRLPVYSTFVKAKPSAIRADRFKRGIVRQFSTDEIAVLLEAATGQMRAMILLGLNCGMYSIDCTDLKWSDISGNILRNQRYKTGIPRLAVLWPETVKAISAVPKQGERVFNTRFGNCWNNRRGHDGINQQFRILLKSLNIYRKGCTFGAFRHTHVSAVNDHPDRSAVAMVRAHALMGMDAHYDFPSIERIKSVTDLARRRLLKKSASPVAPTSARAGAAQRHAAGGGRKGSAR